MQYLVTWPATEAQVALGVRFAGEINALKFPTRLAAQHFAMLTEGAEVDELERPPSKPTQRPASTRSKVGNGR
jgi:hypothetical protein